MACSQPGHNPANGSGLQTCRSPFDAEARQDRQRYEQARSDYLRVVKSHTLEKTGSAATLDLSRRKLQALKMRMEQTQARWSQTNQAMGLFQRQRPSARVRSLEVPTWMLADLEMRQARLASIRAQVLVCEEELASIDAENPSDASRLRSTIGALASIFCSFAQKMGALYSLAFDM